MVQQMSRHRIDEVEETLVDIETIMRKANKVLLEAQYYLSLVESGHPDADRHLSGALLRLEYQLRAAIRATQKAKAVVDS